jgi:GH24 family phage-related lysozyme (muramidase)
MVSNPQRVTSWRGVRFTCRQEAYVETPYYDGVMKLADGSTVDRYSDGFGTLAASRDEHVAIGVARERVAAHIRANDEWFAQGRIKVPVLQHEYDALSSLAYQKWAGMLAVLGALNSGDPFWVNEFAAWDRNSKDVRKVGLANRRGREQYLAREGYYGEIDRFGVYAGSPLVLVEYRPFPKDDET